MKNCTLFTLLFPFCFALQSAAQIPGARWIVPPVIEGIDAIEISPLDVDNHFVVRYKDLRGLCDRTGKMVLPLEYSRMQVSFDGWIIAGAKDGRKMLFNPQLEDIGRVYDQFQPLPGGVAVVYKNNLCGLVNQKGEEIVAVEHERFENKNTEYVFIKGEGKSIHRPVVKPNPLLTQIKEEKAKKVLPNHTQVTSGNFTGFVNTKGDTVIPAVYYLGAIHRAKGYLVVSFDKKSWGVIDAKNKTLYPVTAERTGYWSQSGFLPIKIEKQWGLMRFPNAEMVIPLGDYDFIETYDSQKDLFRVTKNKLVGIVDSKGKVILPVKYDYVSQSDHVTSEITQNKLHGYWYRPTNRVVEPTYSWMSNLGDSLCIVVKDTTSALVDVKTGKLVIPFSPFGIEKKGPYFITDYKYDKSVSNTAGGRLHGLYDRKGKVVFKADSVDIYILPDSTFFINPHYKEVSEVNEHRTPGGNLIRTTTKFGSLIRDNCWIYNSKNPKGEYIYSVFSYLDPPGKEVIYNKLENVAENIRVVVKDNKYGLTTPEGRIIAEPVFDKIENSKDGYILLKYQGKWGVLQNPRFDYFDNLRQQP